MKKILLILTIAVFALGCEKDADERCEDLTAAVKSDDIATVKKIVSRLAQDLESKVTVDDPSGHRDNFALLIKRLNEKCDVNATEFCYGCVYTLPVTSEIRIVIPQGTHSISRVLDIQIGPSDRLICSGMHE